VQPTDTAILCSWVISCKGCMLTPVMQWHQHRNRTLLHQPELQASSSLHFQVVLHAGHDEVGHRHNIVLQHGLLLGSIRRAHIPASSGSGWSPTHRAHSTLPITLCRAARPNATLQEPVVSKTRPMPGMAISPASVPAVLPTPKTTPACLGAMSRWLAPRRLRNKEHTQAQRARLEYFAGVAVSCRTPHSSSNSCIALQSAASVPTSQRAPLI